MPSHTFGTIKGEIKILTIESESIRGNMPLIDSDSIVKIFISPLIVPNVWLGILLSP